MQPPSSATIARTAPNFAAARDLLASFQTWGGYRGGSIQVPTHVGGPFTVLTYWDPANTPTPHPSPCPVCDAQRPTH